MLFPSVLLALISLGGLAFTQSIDPDTVPGSTRDAWCNTQMDSCPLICLQLPGATGDPDNNNCESDTLAFSCICSNGLQPNASEYSQTIPYFICTELNNKCVENCIGDSGCQAACREDNPCGAQSPKRVNTTTTPTPSSSATDVVYTGIGEGSASDGTGAAGRLALEAGQVYGLGIVIAGFLAGFTVLL